MSLDSRFLRRLLVPLALLALWEISARLGYVNRRFFGCPSDIVTSLYVLATQKQLLHNLAVSLWRALAGLAIGGSLGLIFGLLVGLSQRAEDLFDSTFQAVRTLPLLGLVPLFILWFGLGETPRVLLIALGSFFPIYINVFKGVRGVDARLVELALSYGLDRRRLIRDVILPGALPSMLVGFRYSLGIAWLCLVIAEQVNATSGLGWIINEANALAQTAIIMTALVLYAVIGILADVLVRTIERRSLGWQRAFDGDLR